MCSCAFQKLDNRVSPVRWCTVMVQPKGVVPPAHGVASANALSEGFHHLQIIFRIDTPSLGNKLAMDNSLCIPEDH